MNTRTKIISIADLHRLPADAILIIGPFDPLLAAHTERLHQLATGPVVVAVTGDPDALLPLASRLEMAAALRMVDFVLPHSPGLEIAHPWAAIHDDTAIHHQWSATFKEHVRRRSQSV